MPDVITYSDTLTALLSDAEDKCSEAVSHVGYANYAERQIEAHRWVREAFATLRNHVQEAPNTDLTAPIDWYKEMRTCVGDAAELADRISCTDSDVGGALGRLCNVVTHLLDENKALVERVNSLERDAHDASSAIQQLFAERRQRNGADLLYRRED